jgi:hypothetical protein
MPVINIAINIPDEQMTRVQDALKANFGDLTNQELLDELTAKTKRELIDLVKGYENQQAAIAAIAAVSPVDAT